MEFTVDDIGETMGGLMRLAAQQGRWRDTLDAAAEWVGVARGKGRETALATCCDALQSHKGGLAGTVFSREVKRYWKEQLETEEWRRLWEAAAGACEHITSVKLYRQEKIEGPSPQYTDQKFREEMNARSCEGHPVWSPKACTVVVRRNHFAPASHKRWTTCPCEGMVARQHLGKVATAARSCGFTFEEFAGGTREQWDAPRTTSSRLTGGPHKQDSLVK